ncbi:MAG: glycoside hydrolase family 3 C-terminal domain-containing protein [Bacteroidota bacterium]
MSSHLHGQSVDWRFKDASLPLDTRVEILVSQMTTEEKITQLVNDAPAIDRLGVPEYEWWNEALHGVARNGKATVFPQIIGLAATFDPELVRRMADAISTEARAKYNVSQAMGNRGRYAGLTFWSPNVNIFRDPRWGRGQETFGEDPYLTSVLGSAFVRGMQGDDPNYPKTTACAKHFAVHSGPEAERMTFNASPSKQDLYETYLPAFESLVTKANVEGVMAAYNAVYDVPSNASDYLLQDILRDQWKFDGYIVSDCGAIGRIASEHGFVDTEVEAAAAALKAGVNLNCGGTYKKLNQALARGLVTEELIHLRTKELYRTRFRLGLFDESSTNPFNQYGETLIHSDEHVALAREVARKSIVLLKNNDNTLPLSKDVKVPYVTGPFANSLDMLMGNYYGISSNFVTVLEGIADAVSIGSSLNYRKGVLPFHDNINDLNYAPFLASLSDVTICVVGLSADREGEQVDAIAAEHHGDKIDLSLPQNQVNYVKELIKHKKGPLVLVIASGSPVSLEGIEEHCDAILQIWYPGEQGGHAVADVLFGDYSPSGHLPITFPKNVEQLPPYEDYAMQGRTYKYMNEEPLYPFGFGLTYSSVKFSELTTAKSLNQEDALQLEVSISNEGSYDIDEVIQLYVSPMDTVGGMPNISLKAFRRVPLASGESKTVNFRIPPNQLLVVNTQGKRVWRPGKYRIIVGNASPGTRSIELGAAQPVEQVITLR